MSAGDPFSTSERVALEGAVRRAEQTSRAEFSVFVGHAEGEPRAFALRLHAALVAPERSVLVMVDPDRRALEIVTGPRVRRTLHDNQVELAALAMREGFAAGDLAGGLRRGIDQLAEHAREPLTRHADQG